MSPAWLAHLYTATGVLLAFYATRMAFVAEFRLAFLALALAVFVDGTDGWLARALKVKQRLPAFDGGKLDDIVDYLTYVFVPVLIVHNAGLVPQGWGGAAVEAAVLLSSLYGFTQAEAKIHTSDYYFTGFPSYWNIVVLYLFVWGLPLTVNAAVLGTLAVLVFVPIRFVYPSRTVTLRVPTLVLGGFWGICMLLMIWNLPATGGPWPALSLIFPAYYTVLSLWLHARSPR